MQIGKKKRTVEHSAKHLHVEGFEKTARRHIGARRLCAAVVTRGDEGDLGGKSKNPI